ncbi:MAG TPA: transposase [Gammaproteobacteria bacterium]|nr:transposase [Gammaproteobacteria bacterium]
MKTSKSPRRVLETAYLVGLTTLRDYSHCYSPKKFTQPQLFACLVLKEFSQFDYRKLAAFLGDCPELCSLIGLKAVPHFTTFQKAARRLLRIPATERLLEKTLRLAKLHGRIPATIPLAAGDGTGWESHHVSHYFVKRRASCSKYWQKITYARFPKAGILCDCASHLILSIVPERGPGPDIKHFRSLLDQGVRNVRIDTAAFDAGYDAEHTHEYARNKHGVRTLIPPLIGRPTDKRPRGYWRGQMAGRLHLTRYGQRWQAETVISMLKRLMGSALRARNYWSQCREIVLRAITHNVMILRRRQLFYRAGQV